MSEFRRTREISRTSWKFDLTFAALSALWIYTEMSGKFSASELPPLTLPVLVAAVVGSLAFFLPRASRTLLEGPAVWLFDANGYSYSRESKLWPTARQVAYADIARVQVTRLGDRPQSYGLTLVLRSGKTLSAGTWDMAELAEIRDVLTASMP